MFWCSQIILDHLVESLGLKQGISCFAFRTFLRTLLHEICHHLDYELLKLDDSFHTEGFFKRESSLFNQLVAPKEPVSGFA